MTMMPVRRGDRPGRILGLADEVQVVEHLHRLGVPLRPIRRSRLATSGGRLAALRSRRGLRRGGCANRVEEASVILARCCLGGGDVGIDRVARGLAPGRSHAERDDETGGQPKPNQIFAHGYPLAL